MRTGGLAGGCGSPRGPGHRVGSAARRRRRAARPTAHRPPTRPSPTTTAPTTQPPPAPSAIPTTVPVPARQAPGGRRPSPPSRRAAGSRRSPASRTPSAWRSAEAPAAIAAERPPGSGVAVSWDGAAWSDPRSTSRRRPADRSTAPVLPAVSCTAGPSVHDRRRVRARQHRRRHQLVGSGAPGGAAGPSRRQSGRPRSRAPRITDGRGVVRRRRPSAPRSTTPGTPSPCERRLVVRPSPSAIPGPGRPASPCTRTGRIGISCPAPIRRAPRWWARRCSTGTASPGRPRPAPWTTTLAAGADRHGHRLSRPPACAPSSTGPASGPRRRQRRGPRPGPSTRGGELDAISCPTASFCLAADDSRAVVLVERRHLVGAPAGHPGGRRVLRRSARRSPARAPSSAWS